MDKLAQMVAMGAAGAGAAEGEYIEDLFSTYLYEGNGADGGSQTITNGISLGNNVTTYLTGKTITNIGSTIDGGTLSAVNDGVVPSSNTGYCYTAGTLDIYVDMGSATVVTGYLIAPQGSAPSSIFNTIEGFYVKASNDASTWTTVATFSSNGTSTPGWQPGVLRPFVFSNTTGYRYWRLESTDASNDSLTEWAMLVDTPDTGEGGLVWLKKRSQSAGHYLTDTVRGTTNQLRTDSTGIQSSSVPFLSFNSDGFTIGADSEINSSLGHTMASWTFRKAPGFFDIVTFSTTGDNAASLNVSHSLGSVPGCIIIKRLDGAAGHWAVYHRGLNGGTNPEQYRILLSSTSQKSGPVADYFNNTAPTSTQFTVGTDFTYFTANWVAYVFAHDEQIFGQAGNESVIKCGITPAIAGFATADIDLGWEPQFLIVKPETRSGSWYQADNMRGIYPNVSYPTGAPILNSGSSVAESTAADTVAINATGFTVKEYTGGETPYIYIAIRRGPMKTPTDATTVFNATTDTTATTLKSVDVGFPTDFAIQSTTNEVGTKRAFSRLAGNSWLVTHATSAESAGDTNFYVKFDQQNTFSTSVSDQDNVFYNFRRAPGFFDVVAYNGNTNVAQTVSHSLGVTPELMIFKVRSGGINGWYVYHKDEGVTKYLQLDTNASSTTSANWLNNTAPTDSVFSLGTYEANWQTHPHIAYLFATCPGVSKVGSYTGTGSTLNVDCGFTAGARFVLIKRTDTQITGSTPPTDYDTDWYVWDTARGIVAGNDPYLRLNTTGAEDTGTDFIDPYSAGFTVTSSAPAALNASGGTYIFLAIA